MKLTLTKYMGLRRALLRDPLYKMRIFTIEEDLEIGMAMRVENPSDFLNPSIQIKVGIKPWCGPNSKWLVAIAHNVINSPRGQIVGFGYFNPYQVDDYEILLNLPKQESLPCFFLNRSLSDSEGREVLLPHQQRSEVQKFIEDFDLTFEYEKLDDRHDPQFNQAKVLFEASNTARELLDS